MDISPWLFMFSEIWDSKYFFYVEVFLKRCLGLDWENKRKGTRAEFRVWRTRIQRCAGTSKGGLSRTGSFTWQKCGATDLNLKEKRLKEWQVSYHEVMGRSAVGFGVLGGRSGDNLMELGTHTGMWTMNGADGLENSCVKPGMVLCTQSQ